MDGIRFDTRRLREDMVLRGWNKVDLAKRAGVDDMTITRFLNRKHQTAKSAYKIADALGYPVSRYIISNHKKGNHARQK